MIGGKGCSSFMHWDVTGLAGDEYSPYNSPAFTIY
jgi:hypothetical protein